MMNVLRKLQIHEGLKCNLLGDPWNGEGEGGGQGVEERRKWRGTDRATEKKEAVRRLAVLGWWGGAAGR